MESVRGPKVAGIRPTTIVRLCSIRLYSQTTGSAGTAKPSIALSEPLTGSFGDKAGPGITSLEAADPDALDEILKLREKGLRSCVMLPLGYRDVENDWLVNLKKVRKSKEELVTVVK